MLEKDLLTVTDALAILDAVSVVPSIVHIALADAEGLCLADDIRADRDYPPFHKSLMDGYAVRCEDVISTSVYLDVIGTIAAGQFPAVPIGPGQTMAIMTGAPVPQGADGVIPVEGTSPAGANRVRIDRAAGPSRFITPRGADCAAGAVVLPRGTRLQAAQLAVAASVGASQVAVFARPRVAVLSTGDELVAIDQLPGPAQIRNSNNLMLVSLLRRLGCDVTDLGNVRDDLPAIRSAIDVGLSFDILFVTGGMSMGQFDFVPKALIELGVELKITKLRIKPGKPFIFGMAQRQQIKRSPATGSCAYVFGLPGNPLSSFVCVLRLCSRLIARMSGAPSLERWTPASLDSPLEANGSREFYQPAVLRGVQVHPLKWKGSADIYTLAQANALIVRAENAPALPAGGRVDVLEIPA